MRRLERGQEHRDLGELGPGHPPVFRVGSELRFEHRQHTGCAVRSEEGYPTRRLAAVGVAPLKERGLPYELGTRVLASAEQQYEVVGRFTNPQNVLKPIHLRVFRLPHVLGLCRPRRSRRARTHLCRARGVFGSKL